MSIGLFYGSTTGNTEDAAEKIAGAFSADVEVQDIADCEASDLAGFDALILGSATLGDGDLQDDWEALIDDLDEVDLSGKKVALFALGDQEEYPDTFADALGLLNEKIIACGATVVGEWPTEGYDFEESTGVSGDNFMGLVLDEDNQDELSDDRIAEWVKMVEPLLV